MKEKRGLVHNRSTIAWLSVLTGLVLQTTAQSSPILGTVNQTLVFENALLNATPQQPVTGFKKSSISYDAATGLYSYNPGGTTGRIKLRYARTTLPNVAAIPVAQWALDGRSGVNDHAEGDSEANNGTFVGGASINWSPTHGRVLALNGAEDYVQVLNADEISSAVGNRTISLWFKANDVMDRQVLYSEGTAKKGFIIYLEGSVLKAGAWSIPVGWDGNFVTLSESISTNEWRHVALKLKDGQATGVATDKLQGYLDGTLIDSTNGWYVGTSSSDITFGARTGIARFSNAAGEVVKDGGSDSYSFNGSISDVRVYNTALTRHDLKKLAGASVEISQIDAVISQDIRSAAVSGWDTILKNGKKDLTSLSIVDDNKKNPRAFGSLAAFGPNTQVLAVYQNEFALDSTAVANGVDDATINTNTLGERFGPFMTVSTLGNGRVLTMATGDWFASTATWGTNDSDFANNALGWLTAGMTSGDKKILVTDPKFFNKLTAVSAIEGDHIPSAENIMKTSTAVADMSDSAFVAELAEVDVFLGSLDELSLGQLNALSDFALSGKSLLIGSVGHARIYEDSNSPYLNHPDTVHYSGNSDNVANLNPDNVLSHKGDRVQLNNVNQLLRLAGTGVGCYPFPGNNDMLNKMFTRHVATQWNSEYGSLDAAVDALLGKGGPLVFKEPLNKTETKRLEKANLFSSQLVTMSMALTQGDPLRNELDAQLDKLVAIEGSIIQDPVQMALLMHEAENNYRHVSEGLIDQIEPSTFGVSVDTTLHDKVTEEIELRWDRYRLQPLGLYAAPGDTVTLDFSSAPEMIKKGFSVRISQYRHAEFASVVAWDRPPILELAVPINSKTVEIASAYGGDLYIDYFTDSVLDKGFDQFSLPTPTDKYNFIRLPTGYIKRHHKMSGAEQRVTVNGAYEGCTFVLGADTVEDWNTRIKYLPGRMMNLVGKNSVISIDRSILIDRNDLTDPEWMLLAADRMGYEQARIAGLEHQFAFGYCLEKSMAFNQHQARGYSMHLNPTLRDDQPEDFTLEGVAGEGQDFRRHEGDHIWGSEIARLLSSNGEIDAYLWETLVNHSSGMTSPDQQRGYHLSDDSVKTNRNGVIQYDDEGNVKTNHLTVVTDYSATSPRESFAAAQALLQEAVNDGYADDFVYEIVASGKETDNPDGEVHQAGEQNMVFWMTLANSQFGDQMGWEVMQKALMDRATSRWQADMGSPELNLPEWAYDDPKAEGFAVNWAVASGYDISKYMEDLWGFTISADAKAAIAEHTDGNHVWLPFGSEYINYTLLATERITTNDPALLINLHENTVLMDSSGFRQNPSTNSIYVVDDPEHGELNPPNKNQENWTYTPYLNYSGYDKFTYTASHGAGWGQPDETFTVNLYVSPQVAALDPTSTNTINLYGHGATVEEWPGMWDSQDGVPVSTNLTDQIVLNMLHNETESTPASIVYKSMAAMASSHHRGEPRPKRIRAYFKAPEEASYRFYAEHQGVHEKGDVWETVDVWLNAKGSSRKKAQQIISGSKPQQPLRWKSEAVSEPYILTKGKLYYLEIVSSRVSGLSIGMTRSTAVDHPIPADLNDVEAIPNEYLIPYSAPRSIVPEDDAITIASGGTYLLDVMANDKDPGRANVNDMSDVNLVYTSEARNGTVSIVNKQLLYTPNTGFTGTERIAYLIQPDIFGYRARKGVVTISVGSAGTPIDGPAQPAVNTDPVANPDYHIAASSQPVFIKVLANDVDADGDKLTLVSVTNPDKGSVNIHLDGEKIMYTPAAGGLQGAETNTFSYTITDSRGGTNTADVTLIGIDRAVSDGQLPWLETFNRTDITGFQDTGDTAWMIDESAVGSEALKLYGIVNRMLRISATQTENTNEFVEWRSGYIDISNYEDIAISFDAKSQGKLTEDDDWLKLMYRLDNDPTLYELANASIKGMINANAEKFTTFASTNNIAGNQIQVVIRGSTKFRPRIYQVDNIRVDGELRNVPPTANAGGNIPKIDKDGNGSVSVTLDGSKSTDSDGTIVRYVWKVGGVQVATGMKADYDAPVGITTITLVVTDDDGAKDTDRVIVTVEEPAIVDVLDGVVYAPDGVDVSGTNGLSVASSELINLQSITNMTWSLWFSANSLTNRQMLYEQGGKTRGANIYLDKEQVYMGIWGMEDDTVPVYLMSGSVSTGKWNHAVLVLDENTIRAYVNGTETGPVAGNVLSRHSDAIGIGHVNNKTKMHDGNKGSNGSHAFSGQIDELRIYNRSLTTNEVSRIFEFKFE